MHEKHGAYYIVRNNKWTRLASDLKEALIEYANAISAPSLGVFAELTEKVLSEVKKTRTESTYQHYKICKNRADKAFQEFEPRQIKAIHVIRFLDDYKDTPSMANTMRAFMKVVFKRGVELEYVDESPMRDVAKHETKSRSRYLTETEFNQIKEKASPVLSVLMDIAYMTGQRVGDCLKIRYADISSQGIFFCQQKTGNKVMIAMTPDLEDAIKRAKNLHKSVKGLTLFHRPDGSLIPYRTINGQWVAACKEAGVTDARFHDIRAAAATDAKMNGLDSKTLLGHSSELVHNKYLRSKEVPVAMPNAPRKAKKTV